MVLSSVPAAAEQDGLQKVTGKIAPQVLEETLRPPKPRNVERPMPDKISDEPLIEDPENAARQNVWESFFDTRGGEALLRLTTDVLNKKHLPWFDKLKKVDVGDVKAFVSTRKVQLVAHPLENKSISAFVDFDFRGVAVCGVRGKF